MHYLCCISLALCRHITFSVSSVLVSPKAFFRIFLMYVYLKFMTLHLSFSFSLLRRISFLLSPYLPVLIPENVLSL